VKQFDEWNEVKKEIDQKEVFYTFKVREG